MKKILLIGSTSYKDTIFRMIAADLEAEGFEVKVPAFDCNPMFNSYEICEYNRECMEWCDEVRLIWDQRSSGTIFDLGMAFALRKPLRIEYLNPKTFLEVIEKWEKKSGAAQRNAGSVAGGSSFIPISTYKTGEGLLSGLLQGEFGSMTGFSLDTPAQNSSTGNAPSTKRGRKRAERTTAKTT